MGEMIFEPAFFREEDREGFRISEMMKRAWATQLTVLSLFAEICERHGLRWWADYGTLLGAVRHQGYIPWDDDIDVCMPRADYNRIMPILRAELPAWCEIWSNRLNKDYGLLSTFVACRKNVDTGNDDAEAEITAYYHGCPYVTGLDIYPLDYIPADAGEYAMWIELFGAVYYVAYAYEVIQKRSEAELEERVARIEEAAAMTLPRGEALRPTLWNLANQLAGLYEQEVSDHCMFVPDQVTEERDALRPAACYGRTEYLPYEMMKIPVPAGYEEILSVEFGDWRTPVRGTADHGYPFYQEQEKYIRDHQSARK